MDCPEQVTFAFARGFPDYFFFKRITTTSVGYLFNVCSYLGIPMALEKTVDPSTSTLAFANIELDTVLMEARLPQEKLHKCLDLLSAFLRRRKVTLQEIQSLTGLLNFV